MNPRPIFSPYIVSKPHASHVCNQTRLCEDSERSIKRDRLYPAFAEDDAEAPARPR